MLNFTPAMIKSSAPPAKPNSAPSKSTIPARAMPSQPSKGAYAPSTYSESTTYSYSKGDAASLNQSAKPSVKDRLKTVWNDVGNPPTRTYDMQQNSSPKKLSGGSTGPSRL